MRLINERNVGFRGTADINGRSALADCDVDDPKADIENQVIQIFE